MNRYLLIFLLLGITMPGMAQLKNAQQEIGLSFSNLDNFGITYKTGTKASMWRVNTVIISGNNYKEESSNDDVSQSSLGFNLQLGKEFRKEIAENLELRYGADIAFGINYSKSTREYDSNPENNRTNERTIYRPGFNFVLGLNYVINSKIVIGAELLPHFTFNMGKTTTSLDNGNEETTEEISGFSYGISNNSAQITISYRF